MNNPGWIAALMIEKLPGTTLLPVEQPEGLWLIIGFCGLPVLFIVLTLVWAIYGSRPGDTRRTAAVGRLVLLGAILLSFLVFAMFGPEITGALWTVVMGLVAVAFIVDAIRYRDQRRGQAAILPCWRGLSPWRSIWLPSRSHSCSGCTKSPATRCRAGTTPHSYGPSPV
ncbi:MAG: hypothetical protein D6753_07280 [Planctomycetota bacterium]|nr:MAG: hypothetical protein D6753_07280 [Planctomycetota bacterium]